MDPLTTPNLPPSPLSIFERINLWIKESITLKLASIGILMLILLIPQSWIQSLMDERQSRAGEVVHEIAEKWSEEQTLAGPVLAIPYLIHEKIDNGKDPVRIVESRSTAFFLPEDLNIDGNVAPEIRKRGIFESVVYTSSLKVNAKFLTPDFKRLAIDPADVLWSEAHLVIGISDLRGITDNPSITMGGQQLAGEPSNATGIASEKQREPGAYVIPGELTSTDKGIVVPLPWKSAEDFSPNAAFDLRLRGSQLLYFSPVGKSTTVNLASTWSSPSFDGKFIPVDHKITANGFNAQWKVLHYNRPFAQAWKGNDQRIAGSEFGVRLLIPVDQYQKSNRTAKYSALIILLTFVSLFMVELIRKIRIHPVQYILIGSALIIYYVLLLSLSEHIGYDYAYLVATLATIGLVSAYSTSFLENRKTVIFFTSWVTAFYGFIFVIIQEQDYSLLLGSIGLFLIIGAVMYFSRKIVWYKVGSS